MVSLKSTVFTMTQKGLLRSTPSRTASIWNSAFFNRHGPWASATTSRTLTLTNSHAACSWAFLGDCASVRMTAIGESQPTRCGYTHCRALAGGGGLPFEKSFQVGAAPDSASWTDSDAGRKLPLGMPLPNSAEPYVEKGCNAFGPHDALRRGGGNICL